MTYTRPPFSGLGRVLSGDILFQSEKILQRFLWRYWKPLIRLSPYGFLGDIQLLDYEWWVREPASEGRADILAYDRRLRAHVVVELKRWLLNPPAVIQAADYVRPAQEKLNRPAYALLIGSAISREAMYTFYTVEEPMRIALTMAWPGGIHITDPDILDPREENRDVALGYLRNVTGHDLVPDGNPAMAGFITRREKAIWDLLATWEPER